jgi:translation initiation factor 2B subunit (eIF-2B alpha/beta/delta family)
MRNQRQQYVESVTQAGLSTPDARTLAYLRDIVDEGTLGASNHVRLIQDLFEHLCDTARAAGDLRERIEITRSFIARTRGIDTPIIANSMRWLFRGLDASSDGEVCRAVRARRRTWDRDAAQRLEALVRTGVDALRGSSKILLFDYSSTVSAVVQAVCRERDAPPTIVVFESRAIDGGWPYVTDLLAIGVPLRFALDVAMEHEAADADAVLLGVETLRRDGSLLNTIGSRMVARSARAYGADVYGCCDLLKMDMSPRGAPPRPPTLKEFRPALLGSRDVTASAADLDAFVTTMAPELEAVPPELLNGYITDQGVVPTAEIAAAAEAYFARFEAVPDA